MKKLLKGLKWTALVIVGLVALFTLTVSFRQNLTYEAPYPNIKASTDTAVINRGKHLVYGAAHCADCHSTKSADSILALGQDVPLSGGRAFVLPVGTIYSANITSDSTYGIGKYTDGEIARILRYGVHRDGRAVFDFMPFHNLSDEDLGAIISYLRTQKPVAQAKPQNTFNVAGNIVKAFMVKPVGPSENILPSVKEDTTAAYGKYMAMSIANCSGCHTQRDLAGAYTGPLFAGGNNIDGLITPNITQDSSSRIFGWNEEQFVQRFRKGRIIPQSPMPWESFNRMNDSELKAIYKFLKIVPAAKMPVVK